jgi:hypothetical protein
LTFGEPTGLELPEVEVPGSGRLLPTVGEIAGGVTEDMTMVGGFTDVSKVMPDLFSIFPSTVKVDRVDICVPIIPIVVFDSLVVMTAAFPFTVRDIVVVVVVVVVVFASITEGLVGWVLASMLLDLSLLSVELRCASKCSLRWEGRINEPHLVHARSKGTIP